MIIARVESLILDKPVSDAMKRSEKYLQAGADGIMIHSKDKTQLTFLNLQNCLKKFSKYKSHRCSFQL